MRPQDEIAELFNLSEEDKIEMIPSNIETILRNRVNWAFIIYLEQDYWTDRKEDTIKLAKPEFKKIR